MGVDSDWTPTELAADELFVRREYTAALAKYEEAIRSEPRRWVQRKLVAQMIWCLRNTDQYRRAGELFLALSRDDPAMLYFTAIPLRWLPAQATADLEKKSRDWLATDVPVAVLLGASHLLSTSDRNDAVKRLQVLGTAKDPRIAALARALVWSGTFAAASSKQLNQWSDDIETFPDAVRAGPYFVLGRASLNISSPRPRRSTCCACRFFIRKIAHWRRLRYSRPPARWRKPIRPRRRRVYRELVAEHPQTRPATEAQQRLESMTKQSSRRGEINDRENGQK